MALIYSPSTDTDTDQETEKEEIKLRKKQWNAGKGGIPQQVLL